MSDDDLRQEVAELRGSVRACTDALNGNRAEMTDRIDRLRQENRSRFDRLFEIIHDRNVALDERLDKRDDIADGKFREIDARFDRVDFAHANPTLPPKATAMENLKRGFGLGIGFFGPLLAAAVLAVLIKVFA